MKRSNALLIGGVVAAVIGSGGVGFGKYMDSHHEAAQRRHVSALVVSFKERCPPDTTRDQSCFYEPPGLENAARLHIASGEFAEAGLIYAKLQGKQREANDMAEKCRKAGNPAGAGRIMEELSARARAITRFYELPAAGTETPAPAKSSPQAAASRAPASSGR